MSMTPLLGRRAFLRTGLVCFCGLALPLAAPLRLGAEDDLWSEEASEEQLLEEFAAAAVEAEALLAGRTSAQLAQGFARDCEAAYAALLPELPVISPRVADLENRNADSLHKAAWLAALTRGLQARGLGVGDAGRLFYDMNQRQWATVPLVEARAMGASFFSPQHVQYLRLWADWTQERRYPGDWVARFVPGQEGADGFDLGYDYSVCGALEFFRGQGLEAVAPYFCLNDFIAAERLGTGLTRRHTLAQGDELCDFRYKQGRVVTQNWDTEVPRFSTARG